MKKMLTIVLGLTMVLSLTACGGEKAPEAVAPASTVEAEAPSPEAAETEAAETTAEVSDQEYSPEQLAVAEKFAAMNTRFQTLIDTINADENLLAVTELVDVMNVMIDAVNEDDALFADAANLTPEVLANLEESIIAGNQFLDEMEAMVANYSGQETVTVSVEIVNDTGADIHGLAMSPTSSDSWGGNLLDTPLLAGESGVTEMTFTKDSLVWDLLAVDAEGNTLEFMELDFSVAPMEGAQLALTVEDGSYVAGFLE